MLTQVTDEARITEIIDIQRYSSYSKLLRVTARVASAFKPSASLRNVLKVPNRDEVKEAELMWIREEQLSLQNDIKPQTMKRLGVSQVDGVYVVGSRLESWTSHTYNNKQPILLSSKSKFAQLYSQYVHSLCHLGTLAVASKVRAKFWIV